MILHQARKRGVAIPDQAADVERWVRTLNQRYLLGTLFLLRNAVEEVPQIARDIWTDLSNRGVFSGGEDFVKDFLAEIKYSLPAFILPVLGYLFFPQMRINSPGRLFLSLCAIGMPVAYLGGFFRKLITRMHYPFMLWMKTNAFLVTIKMQLDAQLNINQ